MTSKSRSFNKAIDVSAVAALDALVGRVRKNKSLASDITDTVGVVVGIKPAALIKHSGEASISADMLERLSLFHDVWPDKNLRYVSMDQLKAKRLAELHKKVWGKNSQFPREQYEIGELLGYPATSTDYFLERLAVDDVSKMPPVIKPRRSVNRVSDHFQQLVLSPGGYKEELKQYSEPLEDACRHLTPRTYAYLRRYYWRERLASLFWRLLGRKENPSFKVKLVD